MVPVPGGAVKLMLQPTVVSVVILFDTVNPVGAAGLVVTARAVESADVPPAFVALTVIL